MRYFFTTLILLFCFQTVYTQDSTRTEKYKTKFEVNDPYTKIIDNYGRGDDSLYGLRNLRLVLHGVLYRGGANNYFNKYERRDNKNPLPPMGLGNLYKQGFSRAFYLYKKNYKDSPNFVTLPDTYDTLFYDQNSLSDSIEIGFYLEKVYNVIKDDSLGPIYAHCWNGWHQSGYASAIALMQFCDVSNKDAIEYWKKNTDGAYKGYERIIKLIKKFKKYPHYEIEESVKKEICPCMEEKKEAKKKSNKKKKKQG